MDVKKLINLFLKSGDKGGLGQNAKISFVNKDKNSKKQANEDAVSVNEKTSHRQEPPKNFAKKTISQKMRKTQSSQEDIESTKELINLFLKSGNNKGLGQNAKITLTEKPAKKQKDKSVSAESKSVTKIDVANKEETVTLRDPKPVLSKKKEKDGSIKTAPVHKEDLKVKKNEIVPNSSEQKISLEDNLTKIQDTGKTKQNTPETNFYADESIYEQSDLIYTINKDELSSLNKSGEMMITVGLDFGTHQTKVCIESKGDVELKYSFMKFGGYGNKMFYAFPSIIGIGDDRKLRYGFLPQNFEGQIIRYFKQAAFRGVSPDSSMTQELAYYYSVWYISYILFELEEVFGQNFSIQMGAPTDSGHVRIVQQIATRIVASAYKLVEEVFENDKEKFLAASIDELKEITELVPYSDETKEEYNILVFPEAYACLMPLVSQKKIATGMNLMIDIGGGTTDISFFTIEKEDPFNASEKEKPQVYDFFSINKGLNYLICAENRDGKVLNSNVKNESEINQERRKIFSQEVKNICSNIQKKLESEFRLQTSLNKTRLLDALKNRPLVYCGGGSTFSMLRVGYAGFLDKKLISEKEWDVKSILQYNEIKSRGLFPILSTSYGLAISTEHDNIKVKPFRDIFEGIRGAIEGGEKQGNSFGEAYGGFNYADDWDAWK